MSGHFSGAHLAATSIGEAHRLRRAGLYEQSIAAAFNGIEQARILGDESMLSQGYGIAARSLIHVGETGAALVALRNIVPSVRSNNPELDAHACLVEGFAARKAAHANWKEGAEFISDLKRALSLIKAAGSAAELGDAPRLQYASKLDLTYTEGLRLATEGRSRTANRELVLEAVVAEDASRNATAPVDLRPDIGLTIIADLALGAELSPADIFSMASSRAANDACCRVLKSPNLSWPTILMQATSSANVSGADKGKALVLSAKILLSQRGVWDPHAAMALMTQMKYLELNAKEASKPASYCDVLGTELHGNRVLRGLNEYAGRLGERLGIPSHRVRCIFR